MLKFRLDPVFNTSKPLLPRSPCWSCSSEKNWQQKTEQQQVHQISQDPQGQHCQAQRNYEAESRMDSVNIKATKCNKSSNENRIQNEMKTSRYANISTI